MALTTSSENSCPPHCYIILAYLNVTNECSMYLISRAVGRRFRPLIFGIQKERGFHMMQFKWTLLHSKRRRWHQAIRQCFGRETNPSHFCRRFMSHSKLSGWIVDWLCVGQLSLSLSRKAGITLHVGQRFTRSFSSWLAIRPSQSYIDADNQHFVRRPATHSIEATFLLVLFRMNTTWNC